MNFYLTRAFVKKLKDENLSLNIIAKDIEHLNTNNLDLEKQLSSKTELFYGLEYVFNKVKSSGDEENISTNEITPTVSRYPNGSDWQSIAAYTSLKYKPNTKFTFQTGLRYNHIIANANFETNNQYLNLPFDTAKINSGAFTGTAGISWIPSEMIEWKLNASSAFRAPNIDDIGKVFDSEPGSVVVPNNNLNIFYEGKKTWTCPKFWFSKRRRRRRAKFQLKR